MNQAKRTCASLLIALGATSACAQLQMDPLWSIAPGQRSYITSGDLQRGIAYNPVTDSVLIVNRNGGLSVNRVAGATGADLGTLNVTGITGGTAALNMIGVADDGVIYGVNLTTDSTATAFKIYRWTSETAAPTVVFSGDVSGGDPTAANRRFGDNFAVRGSGANTQLLVAPRSGTTAQIFTTADGNNFTRTKLTTDITAGDLGLSVTFGAGDTFLGTASSRNVKGLVYNLAAGTAGTVLNAGNAVIPTTAPVIFMDPSSTMLGVITLNSSPTLDTLSLYQVSGTTFTLADTENFVADNANANGTGSGAFGNGRIYALDSNNGLIAKAVTVPEPGTIALGIFGLGALAVACRRKN